MADRIKGITLEINGDSTSLSKALSSVNSEISKTESNLRDVNKLLKLDPGNTELLQQKQKYLTQAIDETKQKLQEEKKYLEEAGQQDVPSDKMDALKREVEATTEDLKKLETQAKEFGSVAGQQFQQAGDKLKNVGDKITGVGAGMSKGITAPIAAVGAASMAAFKEVDEGMDTIASKTGASGQALTDMENIAKGMATEIPTDFQTAGSAVGEVNTKFGLTGDALKNLSTQFVEFANLNNTDVSTSIDNVQSVLAAFGLKAEDAGFVLDTMNAVGQKTGIDMGTLSATMSGNAAAFQEMGLNAYQSASFLGEVQMSGTDTSAVMAGLKKALKNASASGIPLGDALKNVQDSMKNAKSSTEGLNAAYDLFGAKAGGAIYNAVSQGTLSFTDLSNSMTDYSGNVSTTYQQTQDGADKMTTAFNALKEAGAAVGESLGTTLAPLLQQAADALKKFSDWWQNLPEPMQQFIIKAALIAAVIGPIIVVIGTVVSSIGTIVGAIGTVIGAISGGVAAIGGISIALGPVLLIIAAVVAAIVGIIAIVQNWGAITQWFSGVWSGLCNGLQSAWTAVTGFFTQTLPGFFQGIGASWQQGWTNIKEGAATIWSGIKQNAGTFFGGVKENITTAVSAAKEYTTQKLTDMAAVYKEKGGGIKGTVAAMASGVKSVSTDMFNSLNSMTGGKLGQVLSTFKRIMNSIWTSVSGTWNHLIDSAGKWATDFVNGIVEGIRGLVDKVKQAASDVASAIADFLHFSEPDEGPLSNYHKWMPDFVNGLAADMTNSRAVLATSSGGLAASVAGASTDYSGSLNGIQTTLSGIAQNSSGVLEANIYIGTDRIGKQLVNLINKENYKNGGH